MGNYAPEMSHLGLVTHNSYTQVAAEMGMAALVCYTMFIVTPLKKLGQIARETLARNLIRVSIIWRWDCRLRCLVTWFAVSSLRSRTSGTSITWSVMRFVCAGFMNLRRESRW